MTNIWGVNSNVCHPIIHKKQNEKERYLFKYWF